MLKLAWRNLFRHSLRTAITLAAIASGVVGLILSGGFIHDILTQLGEAVIHSQTGHLQLTKSGYERSGARRPEEFRIHAPQAIEKRIADVPGVVDVSARVTFSGLLNNGKADLPVIAEGIDPAAEARLGTYLMMDSGRHLVAGDRERAVLGSGVASSLQVAPGDTVTLMANTDAGALDVLDLEIVGIFRTYSKDYDARAIRIPLDSAAKILGSGDASVIVVSLARTDDTGAVAAALRKEFSESGLEVSTWQQLNDFYAKTVLLYERQFGVLRAVILLMVFLSVVNSVNMSLFERVAEFGTMRALGDKSSFVARLILTESALLGGIGAAMGVMGGVLLGLLVSSIGIPMPPPPNSDIGYTAHIELDVVTLLAASAIGFVASACAGIPAALRLSKIPVAEALRHAI